MYRGEWAGGERNGEGIFFYSNGARYRLVLGLTHSQRHHDDHLKSSCHWCVGSGQWKENRKEGYGIFLFEDGHLYEGSYVNDKMVDTPPSGVGRNEEVQQLQLYIDVSDVLPSAVCDVNAEIRRLEKLALQHNSDLKKLYKLYSCSGSNENAGAAPILEKQCLHSECP